jgi:hypothetical protein
LGSISAMLSPGLAYTVERVRVVSAATKPRGGDHSPHQSRINQSNLDANNTGTSTMGEKAIDV